LAVSLEHLGTSNNNPKALILAETLDNATDKFLENNKSPSRKVGQLDNRGSHFYLAMYWAEGLANQDKDSELKAEFTRIANELKSNETKIVSELNEAQGISLSTGGYYLPSENLANVAMRPNDTLNNILD
jgi:isocitrate dehydrogenase